MSKNGIDCLIDECESARKVTRSERKRITKQFSSKLSMVFGKLKDRLDFSSKYKNQCVKDFRTNKRALFMGRISKAILSMEQLSSIYNQLKKGFMIQLIFKEAISILSV